MWIQRRVQTSKNSFYTISNMYYKQQSNEILSSIPIHCKIDNTTYLLFLLVVIHFH